MSFWQLTTAEKAAGMQQLGVCFPRARHLQGWSCDAHRKQQRGTPDISQYLGHSQKIAETPKPIFGRVSQVSLAKKRALPWMLTWDPGAFQVDLLRIHVLGREYDALRSGERFFAEGKVTTVAASISQMNSKPGSMVMP